MNKILIIGSYGQVGWELKRTLANLGEVIAHDKDTFDITSESFIRKTIQDIKPTIIVNAAAYTAVDKAETDIDTCRAINSIGPKVLAEEAKKLGSLLIHYSTDYVFGGDVNKPYKESDPTNPQNIYAKTKLEGDENIASSGCKYIILRTSWVYGSRGANFLLTMLKLGKERHELKIVDDQIGAPTWSRLIAEATAQIIMKYDGQDGIYNLTSAGQTSWYDFARTIFELQESRTGLKGPNLFNIPSSEYPVPAKRPKNSVLCQEKLYKTFGIRMPDWKECLQLCFDEIR